MGAETSGCWKVASSRGSSDGTSVSQGTRQSERAAAEAKAGTTDSGRMPGLGVRPRRICSTSGPAWEQEARKAAGAWREAQRKLRPPRLLGRVALSQDQSKPQWSYGGDWGGKLTK